MKICCFSIKYIQYINYHIYKRNEMFSERSNEMLFKCKYFQYIHFSDQILQNK
jgi:hypothetical protein